MVGRNETLGQEPKSVLGWGSWSKFLPVTEGPDDERPSEEPSQVHRLGGVLRMLPTTDQVQLRQTHADVSLGAARASPLPASPPTTNLSGQKWGKQGIPGHQRELRVHHMTLRSVKGNTGALNIRFLSNYQLQMVHATFFSDTVSV